MNYSDIVYTVDITPGLWKMYNQNKVHRHDRAVFYAHILGKKSTLLDSWGIVDGYHMTYFLIVY